MPCDCAVQEVLHVVGGYLIGLPGNAAALVGHALVEVPHGRCIGGR